MSSYPTPQPAYSTTDYSPPASNGLGVAGFVVSLAGLIVCGGFLCPIGLVLSLIALTKAPRGFAIAGAIIGTLGSIVAILFIMIAFGAIGSGFGSLGNFGMQGQTSNEMFNASFDIDNYYDTNNSTLPDAATGTAIVANYNDAWGTPLGYRLIQGSTTDYEMVSAGPDLLMGTNDDYVEYFYASSAWHNSSAFGMAEAIEDTEVPANQIDFAFEQAAQIFSRSFPPNTTLPDTTNGNAALAPVRDPWGNAFKYSPNLPYYHLKSAGPDGAWLTEDDITRSYYFEPTGGQ